MGCNPAATELLQSHSDEALRAFALQLLEFEPVQVAAEESATLAIAHRNRHRHRPIRRRRRVSAAKPTKGAGRPHQQDQWLQTRCLSWFGLRRAQCARSEGIRQLQAAMVMVM